MFSAASKTGSQAAAPNWIDDVFSTYLYTGTGATQTITNGIDLASKGGIVWVKSRSNAYNNWISADSNSTNLLITNNTDAAYPNTGGFANWAYTSTGFNILAGAGSTINGSGSTFCSWTFAEQTKFFDVVTYTGDGTSNRSIAHNLGSAPGMIIVKSTSTTGNWGIYHRSLGATQRIYLNLTNAADSNSETWADTNPTSTNFFIGNSGLVNSSGVTYVAYLFAHDAGGFGAAGTDNVISCGSYTGNGSTQSISLGYEPQYILFKNTTSAASWYVVDVMRGLPTGGSDQLLIPNLSAAELTVGDVINVNATGFDVTTSSVANTSGQTYIYMAIRRPMKPPTSGTQVFSPVISSAAAGTTLTTNFPIDLQIETYRLGGDDRYVVDRLRGVNTTGVIGTNVPLLRTNATSAEQIVTGLSATDSWNNTSFKMPGGFGGISTVFWSFRRAPGFFDQVCYTGTGSARTVAHNLGVVPELMLVKRRNAVESWYVYGAPMGNTIAGILNSDMQPFTSSAAWNNTSPTSSVFTVGTEGGVNASGGTYVAYLFATLAGVSKVGSYTGNGGTQAIACGFTGGARFVLIKRTDSTGGWYVYDTARGMTLLTDPYLQLNSTAAETATLGSVTTTAGGFTVDATILAAINASGGTYIFLAIA